MWPNSQFAVDLFTFTQEIHNGKLHFRAVVYFPVQNSLLQTIFVISFELLFQNADAVVQRYFREKMSTKFSRTF